MPKKIFELAKDLDMGAIELVEALKAKGFAVRNHMTVLEDSDIEKVVSDFQPKSSSSAPAKKKVAKKKAAKKVVKRVSASEAKPAEEAESKPAPTSELKAAPSSAETPASSANDKEPALTQAPKAASEKKSSGTTTRKKAVIRRKVDADGSFETSESSGTGSTLMQALGEDELAENRPRSGLRVVSRPEAKLGSDSTAASADGDGDQEAELYREKVHRFTPVYIPEPDETVDEDAVSDGDDDEKKKADGSKKRLGGLATLMSGKKVVASKSALLNQTKADDELKSYAALSGSGRPLYTTVKKKRSYMGPTKDVELTERKESKRVVKIEKGADVDTFARKLSIKLKDLIDKALDLNLLIKSGDYIGLKLATQLADLYDYRVEDVSFKEDEVLKKAPKDAMSNFPSRPPIITIMGHVDHGKTTLLDTIRNAKVAAGEAGGITQHIGAYMVKVRDTNLTFLDTPGHAAFASMRQRGANVTDIVVLVVAADDGVMPQTRESIRFCQNAGVPIIVAVNKMDKEGVNPDRIKNELTEFHITPEEWGGDTQFVPVSALKGEGIDDLLEAIALQAEILELRADPKAPAEGVVIESKIEQGRGPVATILVQSGTLSKGDHVVVGEVHGRARSLTDHLGANLEAAGPSVPVQILGLGEAPNPGDILNVVKNEREARRIVANRIDERKSLQNMPAKKTVSLEDFFAQAAGEGVEKKTLNIILRTDVLGSYEAIRQSLEPLSTKEVEVKVIGGGVGPISDSDVQLANSSGAVLFGFNMRPLSSARRLAEDYGIDTRTYSIIYELINDVKLALEGLLDPETIEEFCGRAEVKETFSVPKIGLIAGSLVTDGKILYGCNIRLLRDGKIVFDGKLSSLKRFKDDVKEVKNGFECGIGLQDFNDVKVNDIFEAYMIVEKKRTLDDVRAKEEKASIEEAKRNQELAEGVSP
jgi:translation initiation factor IF-2